MRRSIIWHAEFRRYLQWRGRSFQELVNSVTLAPGARGVGPDELMDVLADSGALPQGGPVVDEDSHSNRYDSLSRLRRTG